MSSVIVPTTVTSSCEILLSADRCQHFVHTLSRFELCNMLQCDFILITKQNISGHVELLKLSLLALAVGINGVIILLAHINLNFYKQVKKEKKNQLLQLFHSHFIPNSDYLGNQTAISLTVFSNIFKKFLYIVVYYFLCSLQVYIRN